MATCGACGKNSVLPETYGELTLCKKCAMKILTPSWKNNSYATNDEVEKQRDTVLQRARRAGFPRPAVRALKKYFDNLLIDGLVRRFDGGADRVIFVFADHVAIETSKEFDQTEIGDAYRAMIAPTRHGKVIGGSASDLAVDGAMVAGAVGNALSSIAFGGGIGRGLARAGAGIASEMLARSQQGAFTAPSVDAEFRVAYGRREYPYSNFEDTVLHLPGEEEYGFIRFQCGDEPDSRSDVLFFFKSGPTKKNAAKDVQAFTQGKVAEAVSERAREAVLAQESARRAEAAKEAFIEKALSASTHSAGTSAPDELMKWKQLLDAGAISQQEYNAKKAQLLGL